jgi:phosphoribosyl 1,2-cyclic phosphate phosphodiesterase
MRVMFLGTAAAEGFPGLWCTCEHCEEARRDGGDSLRLRASLLVNDDLIIDLNSDLMQAATRFGLRLAPVTSALITHTHGDHLDLRNLDLRSPGFRAQPLPVLTVFGSEQVVARVQTLGDTLNEAEVRTQAVQPFRRFEVGCYSVTAFPASHAVEGALFYAVEQGGTSLLYALDSGPWSDEAWNGLAEHRFDLVIVEETMGDKQYSGHMGLRDVIAAKDRMTKEAMLKQGSRFFVTHIGHHCNPTHEELARLLQPHDIEVAYDGLQVVVGEEQA